MASWCLNVQASRPGFYQFHHPYPQDGRSWMEQRRWNEFPIQAMRHCIKAEQIYSKDPEQRNDEETKFDRKQIEGYVALLEYLEAHR